MIGIEPYFPGNNIPGLLDMPFSDSDGTSCWLHQEKFTIIPFTWTH